jgi:homocysteine S-methyltransferase
MPRRTPADALADGPLVLDGGLGTRLDERGADVSSALWSAAVLADRPELVLDVHREYLAAGADVVIGASYQVSHDGFARAGLDRATTDAMLARSVELARRACDEAGHGFVAASVGPFGATLGDGSEYRDLGLGVGELRAWHHDRLRVLADAAPDLLAVETVATLAEVEALVAELDGVGAPAWVSVTPAGGRMRSGEPIAEVLAMAAASDDVLAVGVNCCAPDEATDAIAAARSATSKPIVVYPNSGERWDAVSRTWHGTGAFPEALVREWREAGAALIGGCCRTGPDDVRTVARVLARERSST